MYFTNISKMDRSSSSLFEWTSFHLRTEEGRKYLKSLIDTHPEPNDNPAVVFFRQGTITPDMSKVLSRLDSKFIQTNYTKHSRIFSAFCGFLIGDAFGTSNYEEEHDSGLAIVSTEDLFSYATEMMMCVFSNNSCLTDYPKKAISEYLQLKNPIKPSMLSVFDQNFEKYKIQFKKIFGVDWNNFFDCYADLGEELYGGVLSRVLPLTLLSTDHLIVDVWLTDPSVKAFQTVYYMTNVLRMLFEEKDIDTINMSRFKFDRDLNELWTKHFEAYRAKKNQVFDIESNSVYVVGLHYFLLTLYTDLDTAVMQCRLRECSTNYHIYMPLMFALHSAKIGIQELTKDSVMRANLMKISGSDLPTKIRNMIVNQTVQSN